MYIFLFSLFLLLQLKWSFLVFIPFSLGAIKDHSAVGPLSVRVRVRVTLSVGVKGHIECWGHIEC